MNLIISMLVFLHAQLIKRPLYKNITNFLSSYYYNFYYNRTIDYVEYVKQHIVTDKRWFTRHVSIYNRNVFAVLSVLLLGIPLVFAVIASCDTGIWIRLCVQIGTIPLLLLALSCYSFFFMFIHWFVERCQRPFTLIVMAVIVINMLLQGTCYHNIRIAGEEIKTQPTPEAIFKRWIDNMQKTTESYHPMFIVASYGGGIRAGYWTAQILGALQDGDPLLQNRDSSFARHLIATSTVSGGSLGVVTFANIIVAGKPELSKMTQANDILKEDFLSPVFGALLFRDMPVAAIPFASIVIKHDRSEIFEESLAKAWKDNSDKDSSGNPKYNANSFNMFTKYEQDNTIPLMLLNGTIVDGTKEEQGNCIVTGHLNLQEFIGRIDFFEQIRRDIPISTSVTMSCRFPYILPPGYFCSQDGNCKKNSVVDGGYYENSGAETALQFYESIKGKIKEHNESHEDIIVPIFIQIDNDFCPKDKSSRRESPIASSPLGDMIAPIIGILDTKDAHATNADKKAMLTFNNQPIPGCNVHGKSKDICKNRTMRHFRYNFGPKINNPVPLGWYLSPDAITELDDQYKRNKECTQGTFKITEGQNKKNTDDIIDILKKSSKNNTPKP
ncbi:MAG: hypothetical protein HQL03_03095 [Nitrospirae bacterium]|nr:hypothetical protein [Nitrospirota bacterium]